MNADVKNKAAGILKTIFSFTRLFALNTMRRGMILGRYTLACWQQQRLRCAQRKLGRAVMLSLDGGEVNPMLAESVKDALEKAGAVKAGKEKHYQVIEAIREKIRTSKAGEAPAAPREPQPAETGPSEPPEG